jgi:hypothetical protein
MLICCVTLEADVKMRANSRLPSSSISDRVARRWRVPGATSSEEDEVAVLLTFRESPFDPNLVSEESDELDVLIFSSGTTSSS